LKTLRQRIRGAGIRCIPWSHWGGEIDYLPISAKTLFRRGGIPIDILERELKEEGWLFPGEDLLEVLKIESNIRRSMIDAPTDDINDSEFGLVPEDFTEEDFEINDLF
jgi:hypothetical protein